MLVCSHCGKEITTGRATRKYCNEKCKYAYRISYFHQYYINNREKRLEQSKIRRRNNFNDYRRRAASYRKKYKMNPENRLVKKVASQWMVSNRTARKMIKEGVFPP